MQEQKKKFIFFMACIGAILFVVIMVCLDNNLSNKNNNEEEKEYGELEEIDIERSAELDYFNEDEIYMDNIVVTNFDVLESLNMDYYDRIELQAYLSEYLKYYHILEEDEQRKAEILVKPKPEVKENCIVFFVDVEYFYDTIECRYFEKEGMYNFYCDSVDKKEG